jgi:hypothetical protein
MTLDKKNKDLTKPPKLPELNHTKDLISMGMITYFHPFNNIKSITYKIHH